MPRSRPTNISLRSILISTSLRSTLTRSSFRSTSLSLEDDEVSGARLSPQPFPTRASYRTASGRRDEATKSATETLHTKAVPATVCTPLAEACVTGLATAIGIGIRGRRIAPYGVPRHADDDTDIWPKSAAATTMRRLNNGAICRPGHSGGSCRHAACDRSASGKGDCNSLHCLSPNENGCEPPASASLTGTDYKSLCVAENFRARFQRLERALQKETVSPVFGGK